MCLEGIWYAISSLFSCIFKRREAGNDSKNDFTSSNREGRSLDRLCKEKRTPGAEFGQNGYNERGDRIIIPTKYKRWESISHEKNENHTFQASKKLGFHPEPNPQLTGIFTSNNNQNACVFENEKIPSSSRRKVKESKENKHPHLETRKISEFPPVHRKKESTLSTDFDLARKSHESRRISSLDKGEKLEALTQRKESLQTHSNSRLCIPQHTSALLKDQKWQPNLSWGIPQQASQTGNEKSVTVKDREKEKLRQREEIFRCLQTHRSWNDDDDDDKQPTAPQQWPHFSIAVERTEESWPRQIKNSSAHLLLEKPLTNFQLSDKFTLKDNEISFYSIQSWPEILETCEGNTIRKIEMYSLPKKYKPLFEKELKLTENLTEDEEKFLSKFKMPSRLKGSDEFGYTAVKDINYREFFHDLLYMEEYESVCNISQYNMEEVEMSNDAVKNEFKLYVPGLAEKRPNILKNDIVYVRVHRHPTVQYSGCVKNVLKESIVITGFDEKLLTYLANAKSLGKKVLFDVRFTCSRYTYYLQHLAIDIMSYDALDVLFPSSKATSYKTNWLNEQPRSISYINSNIKTNSEQKKAVKNILKRTSGFAPYIIFGPPGTGKTATFVEAVLQVKLLMPNSHILVCSQNNGICDQIASKLYSSGACTKEEILRLVASSKMETVEEEIADITRSCTNKELDGLKSYRIIVSTLMTAGRLVENNEFIKKKWSYSSNDKHTFTHLFIDEAGQASECQTLIPIAGLLKNDGDRGLLVLAGDPKQLGPCCTGIKSEQFGLGVSLLERLMANFSIYQTDEYDQFDSRYITQLVKNYRSHEEILTISNQLFYKNKLEPQGKEDDLCYFSLNKKPAFSSRPVLFHGVKGQEIRDPNSRSIWNKEEISVVVRYISKLFTYDEAEDDLVEVNADEIGVIAPYFLQVQKIKQEFLKQQKKQLERLETSKEKILIWKPENLDDELIKRFNWEKIEVGSTETFQGREKRVIIVSTVRSQPDKIGGYPIGFVKDPKRFNVIMTRAQAKLVVIGNPEALKQDKCWRFLLKTCLENKEYYGCPFSL